MSHQVKFKDICAAFGRVGQESTNFTRTVRFAQISREIGVLFGQAGRDFRILGVNFHICHIYACVKYLTNIMSGHHK